MINIGKEMHAVTLAGVLENVIQTRLKNEVRENQSRKPGIAYIRIILNVIDGSFVVFRFDNHDV